MFSVETQRGYRFDDLTTIQYGWDFMVAQLRPSKEASSVSLHQTAHVGYHKFRYGPAYDQRLRSREGILSFGLLDSDNPATWTYDQLIPSDSQTVFPHGSSDCDGIIDLAGNHGFWHMGQFAADYLSIYGGLPSATPNRSKHQRLFIS